MNTKGINKTIAIIGLSVFFAACTIPTAMRKTANTTVPNTFSGDTDAANSVKMNWHEYFSDPYLNALIDTALNNNQELNITLQEILIVKNEVRARKGEYLPFVNIGAGGGIDKVARYTNTGASEANIPIAPGVETPEPLGDMRFGLSANWELDIWRKLRNAKKSAYYRYLSTVSGKNFMVTNLIAEIANSYYELLTLDNQLQIIDQNIEIQSNALQIVRLQKEAARVTELAVRRFEAQVLHTRGLQFGIQQKIVEMQNRINFLVGRMPQTIVRNTNGISSLMPNMVQAGIPAQLLENRPDVQEAEQALTAAKLDVKVAKARFYPSIGLSAGVGFQAFNASYLLKSPQSLLYNIAGDLMGPLINRNAIKAAYSTANAKQIQAVYNYERTILTAYIEVMNQLSNIQKLEQTYDLKSQEVTALTSSVTIANSLFRSARADYMEVLLTQRDALETKFELVETKKQQMNAMVNIYKALGGGWK